MPAAEQLKRDEMMKHLMDALESGQDIGHYGRLVFIMGARHFLDNDELVAWMTKDKDCDEEKARSLIQQVEQRNYNPPRRERVMEWMQKQGFPICPNPENPDSCNLYKDLEFPHEVYEHIGQYRERKAEAENQTEQ
jgi:DNA primase large subunit